MLSCGFDLTLELDNGLKKLESANITKKLSQIGAGKNFCF
jgi:hypothetical protein